MLNSKEIELTRLGNLLIYFATNTEYCGVTKANKLLYYIDCYHLLEHGRKVSRDRYEKQPEGPVPINAYKRMGAIFGANECVVDPSGEFLNNFIDIEACKLTYNGGKNYPFHKIVPKKQFNPKWFSKSELQVLDEVCKNFFSTTAKELSNQTHKELPYQAAENMYDTIDIMLYLKDRLTRNEIEDIKNIERETAAFEHNYQ